MTASTSTGPVSPPTMEAPTPRRLAVAWQHPDIRSIQPVGLLSHMGDHYEFHYVQNAKDLAGFVPFVGFASLEQVYTSRRLFPLFAQRVMDYRRPDYVQFVRTLDLSPEATPWEQLTRSEGRRSGDTIVLFPEPIVKDEGRSCCNFFVHGIRHMARARADVEDQLRRLNKGDSLALVEEPGNPVNPRALLTSTVNGDCPLGWVPDILLDYVHAIRDSGEYQLTVRQINGPEVPIHQRLLVRLEGRVPPGFSAFSGDRWAPLGRP
jgi:hypothetical protein